MAQWQVLEGKHIVLRKARETDWKSMLEQVWGDEAVYQWMLFQPTLTPADAIHASDMTETDYDDLAGTIFMQLMMIVMNFM